MAYKFTFDLSQFSQSFFRDMAKLAEKKGIHRKLGQTARDIVKKFRVHEITGLPVSDALTIIEDFIDSSVKNIANRKAFLKTKKRAVILPHCSRKFMDSRCKASFNTEMSSYSCNSCSSDCLVNKASKMAKKKGYDVFIVPGGSCIKRILQKGGYEGIVGVACTEEIGLGMNLTERMGVLAQGVSLIKNGCSATKFSLESLENVL